MPMGLTTEEWEDYLTVHRTKGGRKYFLILLGPKDYCEVEAKKWVKAGTDAFTDKLTAKELALMKKAGHNTKSNKHATFLQSNVPVRGKKVK